MYFKMWINVDLKYSSCHICFLSRHLWHAYPRFCFGEVERKWTYECCLVLHHHSQPTVFLLLAKNWIFSEEEVQFLVFESALLPIEKILVWYEMILTGCFSVKALLWLWSCRLSQIKIILNQYTVNNSLSYTQ